MVKKSNSNIKFHFFLQKNCPDKKQILYLQIRFRTKTSELHL